MGPVQQKMLGLLNSGCTASQFHFPGAQSFDPARPERNQCCSCAKELIFFFNFCDFGDFFTFVKFKPSKEKGLHNF